MIFESREKGGEEKGEEGGEMRGYWIRFGDAGLNG